MLYVANIKGHPSHAEAAATRSAGPAPPGFNSHQYHGSLSLVPVPEATRAAGS